MRGVSAEDPRTLGGWTIRTASPKCAHEAFGAFGARDNLRNLAWPQPRGDGSKRPASEYRSLESVPSRSRSEGSREA